MKEKERCMEGVRGVGNGNVWCFVGATSDSSNETELVQTILRVGKPADTVL